jgi:8-oxo-dGTP pyrophosphatase MutT (NUDIX family)
MRRHFTVTGFVSNAGATALHWHRLGMWLPPGGHVEPDEDPVQAVLREVEEETGLRVEIVATSPRFAYGHPAQLDTPAGMAVYDIPGDRQLAEPHQHIDLIYFTRPLEDAPALPDGEQEWAWFDIDLLRRERGTHPLTGRPMRIAEDVRELGIAAIEAVRDNAAQGAASHDPAARP